MDRVAIVMSTLDEDGGRLVGAVRSCIEQTHQNIHLFVSTVCGDKSLTLLPEMFRHYHNIHYVSCSPAEHPGRGPRGSFYQINRALEMVVAGGSYRWFCFASGNDTMIETKIASELARCEETGAMVCYSAYYVDRCGHRSIRRPKPFVPGSRFDGNFINDCALVNMDLWRKYGPFDLDVGNMAYWDFWLRIYDGEGPNVFRCLDQPTWVYYQHDDSQHLIRRGDKDKRAQNDADRRALLKKHGRLA